MILADNAVAVTPVGAEGTDVIDWVVAATTSENSLSLSLTSIEVTA
jgi:hypothetical protein